MAGQDDPLSPDQNPMDGVSTKTSGTFLNGAAGPKGGGQDARNNVVHRPEFRTNPLLKSH